MRPIKTSRRKNPIRVDVIVVTTIASILFLSTLIPTAPTMSDAKTQQTMNGTPSTTRGLRHEGSMTSSRITVPTPNPSSNADILPNNITSSYYFYSFSTAPLSLFLNNQ